jgi:hypothetical protein
MQYVPLAESFCSIGHAYTADNFIRNCSSEIETLVTQILVRRISRVVIEERDKASMRISLDKDFEVVIPDRYSPMTRAFALGYSLGETFFYNTTKKPPVLRSDIPRDFSDAVKKDFCLEFSRQWVNKVGVSLAELCINSLIPINC